MRRATPHFQGHRDGRWTAGAAAIDRRVHRRGLRPKGRQDDHGRFDYDGRERSGPGGERRLRSDAGDGRKGRAVRNYVLGSSEERGAVQARRTAYPRWTFSEVPLLL